MVHETFISQSTNLQNSFNKREKLTIEILAWAAFLVLSLNFMTLTDLGRFLKTILKLLKD